MRLSLKILMVMGMTIALLIPLTMIRGTVDERQRYRTQAVQEVAMSTAGAQVLEGPVLFVPYEDRTARTTIDDRGVEQRTEKVVTGTLAFFPARLRVDGSMRSIPRMRGLHEVRVFELDTTLRADFKVRLPPPPDSATRRSLGEPRLGIGIGDVRGLVGVPSLRVGGTTHELQQGLGSGGRRGLHTRLAPAAEGEVLAFGVEFKATLQGTETLSIAPLAERNEIVLDSTWPHPKFHGDFLPRSRTVDRGGFRANWEVSSLATNAQSQYQARMQGREDNAAVDAVVVTLVDPVNVYSQVDRATKYGLLFVLLTFVAFFMFETLRQLRIHPIQYGLVGLALAIFFLLLLALSERIAFGLAYLAAAVACVGLIGYYVGHVLHSRARGLGFAVTLGVLYAALYGLLVSEDNALVLGAGLLFSVLASIMVLTRRIDWYRATTSS
jgi:inner membrane protein